MPKLLAHIHQYVEGFWLNIATSIPKELTLEPGDKKFTYNVSLMLDLPNKKQ